jgi:hypothetical protein
MARSLAAKLVGLVTATNSRRRTCSKMIGDPVPKSIYASPGEATRRNGNGMTLEDSRRTDVRVNTSHRSRDR